jgi:hypothetical protein
MGYEKRDKVWVWDGGWGGGGRSWKRKNKERKVQGAVEAVILRYILIWIVGDISTV